MTMPGSTGISLKPNGGPPVGHTGHPGGHPGDMNAMTKGCLAGTGVCFISHEGEVFPCGYLPALAGDLRKQSFAEIWNDSAVFGAAARRRQPERQVRLLRVPSRLHGMPRARLRRHRRLPGGRTFLRLRAWNLEPDGSHHCRGQAGWLRLKSYSRECQRRLRSDHGSSHQHRTKLTTENDGRPPRTWRVGHVAGPPGDWAAW